MPPGKRPRITASDCASLQRILHSGGISQSGLATLLQRLRENPVECDSLYAVRKANLADFVAISRATVLPLTSGSEWTWEYLDPNKLLCLALDRSVQLRNLFTSAMERKPPTPESPWKLVIGFDAFIPGIWVSRWANAPQRASGSAAHALVVCKRSRRSFSPFPKSVHPLHTGNKLNVDRSKSTMVLSFTFLELGQAAMTEGVAWLTPICLRTNVIDEVPFDLLRELLRAKSCPHPVGFGLQSFAKKFKTP